MSSNTCKLFIHKILQHDLYKTTNQLETRGTFWPVFSSQFGYVITDDRCALGHVNFYQSPGIWLSIVIMIISLILVRLRNFNIVRTSHTWVNASWAKHSKQFLSKITVSFEEIVVSEGLKHAGHPPDKNVQRQVFQ